LSGGRGFRRQLDPLAVTRLDGVLGHRNIDALPEGSDLKEVLMLNTRSLALAAAVAMLPQLALAAESSLVVFLA